MLHRRIFVPLVNEIDPHKVEATFRNGVPRVELSKAPPARRKGRGTSASNRTDARLTRIPAGRLRKALPGR